MAEKSPNEIPRALRDQFDRGMAAYNKDNFEYAIALFTDLLQKEPAYYACREALRAAQFRRGASSGGLFKKLLGQVSPALAKAQIALRTNPAEALHLAEQVLNSDPKNVSAHETLAKAALAVGLPRTAVLSLEIVFKNQPGDRTTALRLAEALVAAGQVPRADRIYADLLAANPADLEVARIYKDLGARRTLSDQGYASLASGEGSYRDALRNPEEAASLEQAARQVNPAEVSDRLLRDYQSRLAAEPDNRKLQRQIADLLASRADFDAALAAYQQIAQAESHADPSLQKTIAEVRLRQFDHRLRQLDPAHPDHAEQRAQIERDREAFELEDCRARVERYPTDLAIRFELGQLYFRLGRIPEAIQELQKAQAHPSRRIAALGLLAKCFGRRQMHDLACRTLQNALKEKPVLDDEKKDLIYELGCAFEKMGRPDDAVEQFKLIYENDIGYRDVAARVDAFYAAKSGGPS